MITFKRQSGNVVGSCATRCVTFEAPIIARLPRESKSRWDQSDISAKGSHQVALKIAAVPISGQLHSAASHKEVIGFPNSTTYMSIRFGTCLA